MSPAPEQVLHGDLHGEQVPELESLVLFEELSKKNPSIQLQVPEVAILFESEQVRQLVAVFEQVPHDEEQASHFIVFKFQKDPSLHLQVWADESKTIETSLKHVRQKSGVPWHVAHGESQAEHFPFPSAVGLPMLQVVHVVAFPAHSLQDESHCWQVPSFPAKNPDLQAVHIFEFPAHSAQLESHVWHLFDESKYNPAGHERH